jgi:hypothetical protein
MIGHSKTDQEGAGQTTLAYNASYIADSEIFRTTFAHDTLAPL